MGEGTLINKQRISSSQYALLLFLTIITTAVLYVPSITAREAKQSAWLVPILASGAGFFSLWLVLRLGQRFPGQTLIQYSTNIVGKFLGKILGLGYILFFHVFSFLIMRQFMEAMKISLLENTPIWFIGLCFALVGSYGALLGIEVIARSAQFIFPLFIVSFISIIFFAFQDIELKQLFPILEGGVGPIIKASLSPASWFGESVILAFLLPHINKPKEIFRKSSWALLMVILVFSGDILLTLLLLGPELTAGFDLPFWRVIRYIEVGRTFLRIETIVIFLWISAVIVKFTLILYLGSRVVAEVFDWKSHKLVVLPSAVLLVAAGSILVNNSIDLNLVLSVYWPPFAIFFEIVIPLLLLAATRLLKKGKKTR